MKWTPKFFCPTFGVHFIMTQPPFKPVSVTNEVSATYCHPDGAWTGILAALRGCTRLRLATPPPMTLSLLTELFQDSKGIFTP